MLAHFAVESARDFFRVTFPIQKTSDRPTDDQVHVEAAVAFIMRSIKQGKGRASSKGYKVGKGWLPPYRETSGYIIPTLLDLAERLNRPELALTADRMGAWLSEVQEPSGGFIERDLNQYEPVVFNTGQILHGFNALILRRGRQDLVSHARRAADFLVSSSDETGSFVRNERFGLAHAYNVRSAWALLTLGRLLGDKTYEKVALANAEWTLMQQTANGFFLNNIFQPGRNANTHGIAYVLQGLLEIHCIGGRESYFAAVRRSAERIISVYRANRHLASEIGENWEFLSSHRCLTGYAQLAIVFFRLYRLDGDRRYLKAGLDLLHDVAATQDVTSPGTPHYGGIKGSLPIYGRYAPLQYPNWATKFFIDALLAKQEVLNAPTDRVPLQLSAG
jgi:hypothetical protein